MNFTPGVNFKYLDEMYLYITDNVYCTKVDIKDISYGNYERYLFYTRPDTYILVNHYFSEIMYSMFGVVFSPDFSSEISQRLKI